jgi:uncharacterized protein (TIGR03437 family)
VSNYAAVTVQSATPEFFSFAPDPVAGKNPIAAVNPVTHALTGPTGLIPGVTLIPAKPGDYVEAYGTAWGATNPALGLGVIPGAAFNLAAPYTVMLGGVPLPAANILYAGASPCCAGLMQLDFQVPQNTPSGNQSLVITVGGTSSPAGAYIPIQ